MAALIYLLMMTLHIIGIFCVGQTAMIDFGKGWIKATAFTILVGRKIQIG